MSAGVSPAKVLLLIVRCSLFIALLKYFFQDHPGGMNA
jgi:hypothetical protein